MSATQRSTSAILADRVWMIWGVRIGEAAMIRGLTDKESMAAIMADKRGPAQPSNRIKELASKGSNNPSLLAPAEIQELCDFVLRQRGRHRSGWQTIVDKLA